MRILNACINTTALPAPKVQSFYKKMGGEPTFAAMRTNGRYADDVAANSSSLVISSSHHSIERMGLTSNFLQPTAQ